MMPWLSAGKLLQDGASAAETVGGLFAENPEKEAQRASQEQMALLAQYRAEFSRRTQRTAVDALADALNRLIRPVITLIVLSLFVLAYISPTRFAAVCEAMALIPIGYWGLLSVVIGFYFGGRMQLKAQDFKLNAAIAKRVLAQSQKKETADD